MMPLWPCLPAKVNITAKKLALRVLLGSFRCFISVAMALVVAGRTGVTDPYLVSVRPTVPGAGLIAVSCPMIRLCSCSRECYRWDGGASLRCHRADELPILCSQGCHLL